MFLKALTFGVSISFISWIVGMVLNSILMKTDYYKGLSNLNFIESKSLNKNIGIGFFKWIVKNTPFKFFNPGLKLKNKVGVSELNALRKQMTIAEIGHLIGFVFVTIFALVKIVKGEFLSASIIMLVNVFMNLYPSLLQQENKRRIDRYKKVVEQH